MIEISTRTQCNIISLCNLISLNSLRPQDACFEEFNKLDQGGWLWELIEDLGIWVQGL